MGGGNDTHRIEHLEKTTTELKLGMDKILEFMKVMADRGEEVGNNKTNDHAHNKMRMKR